MAQGYQGDFMDHTSRHATGGAAFRGALVALAVLLPLAAAVRAEAATDPRLKLWNRVEQCIQQAKVKQIKYPCVRVSERHDYVIANEVETGKQGVYLLLAATRISGIEDPRVVEKPFSNFFRYGWAALTSEIKRKPAELAMAINSKTQRTQDQSEEHTSELQSLRHLV